MEHPRFYSLVEGNLRPICYQPFHISPYTSEIHSRESQRIVFPMECFAHPVHVDCLFYYRDVKNITDLKCFTCKRPLEDETGFIYFNSMQPPPTCLEPPNLQLPLAPAVIPLGNNGEMLLNYPSGCCEYPHFRREWFIIAEPCGHSIHTGCYLNMLLGD